MSDLGPAWFIAKVDQRLALLEHTVGKYRSDHQLVMTPISEPREGASQLEFERWDRTCDNCGAYCPPTVDFYTGHAMRKLKNGVPVCITFGVCSTCKW